MTRIVPALLAIAAGAVTAQEPTFRRDTQLVRLDVSVLDSKKQPVRDLTAADFRITEGRRLLSVRAFQIVEVPTMSDPPSAAPAGRDAPALRDPAGASNAANGSAGPTDPTAINTGRLVVLVMDDDMTPPDPRWALQAKLIARSIVEGIGPHDRIATRFTRSGTTRLELTTDRSTLLAQIETFKPGGFLALPPTATGADEVPRYWRTMRAIEYTIDSLAPLTDRQKVIVYVGPGLPVDQRAGAGFNGDLVRAMATLFRTAARGNVAVYTFDPTGLDTLYDYVYDKYLLGGRMAPTLDQRPPMSSLMRTAQTRARETALWTTEFSASVAENTGGRALVRSDIFEPAVAQMFADTSFYYLIAVDPPTDRPDGRFHEVTVRVNRPNVDVRARRGYYYDR